MVPAPAADSTRSAAPPWALLPPVDGRGQTAGDRRRLLVVLGAGSAFAMALLAARWVAYDSTTYRFLLWNLFLAWVPVAFALALAKLHKGGGSTPARLLAAAGWLAFFPNAPYLCTDLLHLQHRAPVPHWYDVLLLTAFSWNGLLLGFASLQVVHGIVQRRRNVGRGWAVAVAALFLAGFGIYLGRFERWNSWDVVTDPLALIGRVGDEVLRPWRHPRTWGVTLILGGFLTLAYAGLLSLGRGSAEGR